MAQKKKFSSSSDDQCWYYSKLEIYELHHITIAAGAALTDYNWWVSSDVHSQQLLGEAGASEAAANVEMSDDAADSDAAADAGEWTQWKHAGAVCVIHSDNHSAAEHLLHDAAVRVREAEQDNKEDLLVTEKKADDKNDNDSGRDRCW